MTGTRRISWMMALAVALVAGTAQAQMMPPPGPMAGGPVFGEHRPPLEDAMGPRGVQGRFWNNPKIAEKLKLTDEQRKAMDQILLDHREKLIDLRAALEKAELPMESLLRVDQPNEAKVLAQIDKVAQARAELEKANARFLLAIRAKLTPEQWKLLEAERRERREPGQNKQRPDMEGRPGLPPPPPGGPMGKMDDGPASPEDEAAPANGGN